MPDAQLSTWIVENAGFQRKFEVLLRKAVSAELESLELAATDDAEQIDWRYLLLCSSILAGSELEKCRAVALRIAQSAITLPLADELSKNTAALILDIMGNKPAITLATSRNLIQSAYADKLSFFQFAEKTRRTIRRSLHLSKNLTIEVNDFQKTFWENADKNDWLSVSAPTSAGKSFIVEHWLLHFLLKNKTATIVYLVPTRALISQVQKDLNKLFAENGIPDYSITTLPMQSSLASGKANLLIFTQERLHIFLSNSSNVVDLLVIDEAHKIGDNYRGVFLQHAIEIAVARNATCRVLFASPMTENPELLMADAPANVKKASFTSEEVTVNQNLLWVSQEKGRPRNWLVELVHGDQQISIGKLKLPFTPTPESKRLSFLAHALGSKSVGNLIYANGAADSEKVAKQIYGLVGNAEIDKTQAEIQNLIEAVKKIIHPEYALGKVLEKGIAFHYGNMPLLIRNTIEKLFSEGKIRYLICTSTLIEGVNLPCQNLFVRGPTKGRGNPMNETDFWNLAGRAGRWGKEFQGNIFCIDAKVDRIWKHGPPRPRQKYTMSRVSDAVILDPKFLEYISNEQNHGETPNMEYTLSYLCAAHMRHGSVTLSPWASRFEAKLLNQIEEKISELMNSITIPKEIILKSPGISPKSMDNLFQYFINRTDAEKKEVTDLLPVPPESEEALDTYAQILHRINRHLGTKFGSPQRIRQLALLIIDWMRGYPLARIISSRENFYRNSKRQFKLPNLIRECMADVEEFARFQAPKYLACYTEVLRYFFQTRNMHENVERLFDLNILLEFGVSQKTQLALMGLGLSRSSAIAVSELIAADSLSEDEVIAWLKENNWMTADMPELIKAEIRVLLEGDNS